MLRDIYVHRDTQLFQSVQQFSDIISEQIGIRASLICGKLPREEVRDLRTKLTKKMDYLNHHLQLDLVVRDKDGNILNPDKTSAVSLFREHKLSSDNRSRNLLHSSGPRSNSYMLLLSVKNFTWKRTEDMELFLSVYTTGGSTQEPRAPRPLCENYVVKWTRQRMARDMGLGQRGRATCPQSSLSSRNRDTTDILSGLKMFPSLSRTTRSSCRWWLR